MAKRPTQAKKVARLRKVLRRTLPAFIDLVEYLEDYNYAQTAGEARKMLVDGKVRHESHIVGRKQVRQEKRDGKTQEVWVPQPIVPASYRAKLTVLP